MSATRHANRGKTGILDQPTFRLVTIKVDEESANRVDAIAKKNHLSRSSVFRMAIVRGLAKLASELG